MGMQVHYIVRDQVSWWSGLVVGWENVVLCWTRMTESARVGSTTSSLARPRNGI